MHRLSWANLLLSWSGPIIFLATATAIVLLWWKERKRIRELDTRRVLRRPNDQVSDNSRLAIKLLRRLIELAEAQTSRGVAVVTLDSMWASFGCWSMTLYDGARNTKAFWDGFERILSIQGAIASEVKVKRDADPFAVAQEQLSSLRASGQPPDRMLFVRRVVTLAEDLAAQDVTVAELRCDRYDRHWTLELRNGTTYDQRRGVVRVLWREPERVLSVEVASVEKGRAPIGFKTELVRQLSETEDAIAVTREYVMSRLQ